MPRCAWGLCNSDSRYGEKSKRPKQSMVGVKFFPFPKPKTKLDRCMAWIKACGRKDFTVKHVTRSTYVCSKHFVYGSPNTTYPDPFPALEHATSQDMRPKRPLPKRNMSSSKKPKLKELEMDNSPTSIVNTSVVPQDSNLQSDEIPTTSNEQVG